MSEGAEPGSDAVEAPTAPEEPGNRRLRGDRGSYIVLVVFAMTSIMTVTALVVDVAVMQLAKRQAQTAADLAALAAGPALGNPSARDPRQACQDAFVTARLNLKLPAGATMPCNNLPATCNSGSTTPATVTASDTAGYTVRVQYPVLEEDIDDDSFEIGSQDGQSCERMTVTIAHDVPLFFGGITGREDAAISAHATVRGTVGFHTKINPALLLLQRYGCSVLQTSGQGQLIAEAFDASHPGVIAVDSHGNTSGEDACSANSNAGGYVVFGQATPSGQPSIQARSGGDLPGYIHLYAIRAESARTAYNVPSGVTPAPSTGPIVSRKPVDDQFNPSSRPAITNLRASATSLTGMSLAAARSAGYVVYPQDVVGGDCRPSVDTVISATKVFVNCSDFNPRARVIFTSTNVVFSGTLSIGPSNAVRLPNARQIIVNGSTNHPAVDVSGRLAINDGVIAYATASPACADRSVANGVLGTHMVILNGPLTSATSAIVSMCQTFLYMADLPSPTQRTTGGTCDLSVPCPQPNTGRGYVRLFGTIDWSAPNQVTHKADATNPYEDVALWTETSDYTEIKGQGATRTTGIYFLPNAHFVFSGQASQDIQLNAQFISKSLNMSGQGSLVLKPNPNDAVAIPFADYYLIR